ncbi:hypothetical protein RRG08_055805 [Elysia crispata]|uniref:Uncharacterized protein n=1 Tax=Elysia crispata TaxID=231223 RepID=A0AAE1CLE0_9GAST|nr:hypothetical protein RRG08_055805 [Elysia crispata]
MGSPSKRQKIFINTNCSNSKNPSVNVTLGDQGPELAAEVPGWTVRMTKVKVMGIISFATNRPPMRLSVDVISLVYEISCLMEANLRDKLLQLSTTSSHALRRRLRDKKLLQLSTTSSHALRRRLRDKKLLQLSTTSSHALRRRLRDKKLLQLSTTSSHALRRRLRDKNFYN